MADADIIRLLQRIKNGDKSARKELLELLTDKRQFYFLILKMARDMMPEGHPARRLIESQDLLQSAFGEAFKELGEFKGSTRGSFFAWLKAIIRSKVERARRSVEREDRPAPKPPEPSDPIEEIITRDSIQRMWQAIQKLPLHQRLIIELKIREYSAVEIGLAMSLTSEAVRKREERAVESLREMMAD